MNRKQWKAQGQQDDDLVSVLRRRAKQLSTEEHFNEQYIGVFLRAADELQARRMAAIPGGDEQLAVNAIADNRRLRNTLVKVYGQIRARKPAGWPDQVMTMAEHTLAAVRPHGEGRIIMAIQINKHDTRANVEAIVASLLDAHFHGGPNGEEEESARRDDAEHQGQSHQGAARRAEEETAGDGSRSGQRIGPARGQTDR